MTALSLSIVIPDNRILFYQCQRCTACCRWPGAVRLVNDEIDRIAGFLNLEVRDFVERYTRILPDRTGLSLVERPNHECIFLEGNQCVIQPVKPDQCAGFPNRWNFPGWTESCHAIPVLKLKSEHE